MIDTETGFARSGPAERPDPAAGAGIAEASESRPAASLSTGDEPVFVVGPGRSGTTLLRSLLSAHSRLVMTPETHFMEAAEGWRATRNAPDDVEAFFRAYAAGVRFRDLGVSPQRCRDLVAQLGGWTYENVFRALLAAYGEKTGKPRIGEKTPGHARFLAGLLEWFPRAKILVAQRDPRAVVASQMKTAYVRKKLTPFSLRHGLVSGKRPQEIAYFADHWVRVFEQQIAPFAGDPRCRTIVYETLVKEPEAELRAICDFIGEPFEPAMLTDRNKNTVPEPAAEWSDRAMQEWKLKHHARSLEAVSPDSLDKWKSELSVGEIAMIEGRCHSLMQDFGYEPMTPPSRRAAGRVTGLTLAALGTAEGKARTSLTSGPLAAARWRAKSALGKVGEKGVERGMPPVWAGYRWIRRESAPDFAERRAREGRPVRWATIHAEEVARNPLPCNVRSRDTLPDDRGWWGYSVRDVPERTSGETFALTVPDALLAWYRDEAKAGDFYPAIVTGDGRALDMRELRFRPKHGEMLRQKGPPARLDRATWIAERVYHNYSHWFTAHLPKLLLLKDRGALDGVLLPPERPSFVDASMRLAGLDPDGFATFDMDRPLRVGELTVLGTDRFRPELLRLVPRAFGVGDGPEPHRKILISRAKATRRRLVNEEDIWALLEPAGFERVAMEDLSFEAQVALMKETAVLCAPHGAGLTNMLFCPEGATVVEIADPGFPNPNFYAVAAAMGHRYWMLPAVSLGDAGPVDKDLKADLAAFRDAVNGFAGETERVPLR